MTTLSVNCNSCGAPLTIGPSTNFVTCNLCGSKLVVRRTGSATFTETATGPAASPAAGPALAQRVEHLAHEAELARIDREWQIEREQYLMTGRYGNRYVPTPALSIFSGVLVAGFG